MRMYHDIRGIGQQQAPRGVDSPATGHEVRVPARTPLIHLGGRYIGYLHKATMYPWLCRGIPNRWPTGGHSIASVRRRHHVLHTRIDGCGSPRLHYARHILELLRPAAKKGEVFGCRHWLVLRGISLSLCNAGHNHRLAPHPLPRASFGRGKTPRSRLAADNGEDWGLPWGLAGSASLPWWSLGSIIICTGGHSYIFYD